MSAANLVLCCYSVKFMTDWAQTEISSVLEIQNDVTSRPFSLKPNLIGQTLPWISFGPIYYFSNTCLSPSRHHAMMDDMLDINRCHQTNQPTNQPTDLMADLKPWASKAGWICYTYLYTHTVVSCCYVSTSDGFLTDDGGTPSLLETHGGASHRLGLDINYITFVLSWGMTSPIFCRLSECICLHFLLLCIIWYICTIYFSWILWWLDKRMLKVHLFVIWFWGKIWIIEYKLRLTF